MFRMIKDERGQGTPCLARLCSVAILFLTISASTVFAQNLDLSEIQDLLPKDSIVRASFVQTKEMLSFENPLVSTGRILAVQNRGVIWLTETPAEMTRFISLDENEMSRSELAMITPFFTGDFSTLQRRFSLELTKADTSWTLQTTPRSTALRRRLESISINSSICNKYQEVIIISAGGNSVKINFKNELPTPQVLSEDEEKLFMQR